VRLDRILVVNAGSSSLKLRVLDAKDHVLESRDLDSDGDWEDAIGALLDDQVTAVGHRVVHGGGRFVEPTRLDTGAEETLRALSDLAPLHNPPALRAIATAMRLAPTTPNIACFDTSFHTTLAPEAFTYALPESWGQRWNLRRFGSHGLSHSYASRRAAELIGQPIAELRLVTAHLGAGASLAAIAGGRSIDTTMGFTPLDGLVMATRSGAVDPGLLLWVQRHGPLSPDEMERALNHEAGLLGISGRSGDMREVIAGTEAGDDRSQLALDVYSHRLAAGIAAMATSLGSLDGVVFTGGVGEHCPPVRAAACRRLELLGLELDQDANSASAPDSTVSPRGASTAVLLVRAREDLEIAAGVRAALEGS